MNLPVLIHTFDYEMFIKQSGTVQNCMLEPTEELIKTFKMAGGKATFFVDTTFLALLQQDSMRDHQKVIDQLKKLVEHGHRIELHLHPSWKDANRESDGKWSTTDFSKYSLFSLPQNQVENLFESGIAMIEEALRPIDKNYKVSAFRAGGWSLGDGKAISAAMKKYAIRIDSSVAPGMYRPKNLIQCFDFRKSPRNLPYWYFSDNPALPDKDGTLLEIPISTYRLWPFSAAIRKLSKQSYKKKQPDRMQVYGDGETIAMTDILSSSQIFLTNIKKYLLPKSIMYTLQNVLPGETDQFLSGGVAVTTISHPKNICASSIEELHRFSKTTLTSITLLDYYKQLKDKE